MSKARNLGELLDANGDVTRSKLTGQFTGHILPNADNTLDIGSASNKIRDIYVSDSSLHVGAATISATGTKINLPVDSQVGGAAVPKVDLDIAPEVLVIDVAATGAGSTPPWLWNWTQSTLPYARLTIVNSPENAIALYKQGTYQINNFAKYTTFGAMTQTHTMHLKWIEGQGTQNNISWATVTGPISHTNSNINSGTATNVQRLSVSVPTTITVPTLTAPTTAAYTVTAVSGAYVFAGNARVGNNPNIGPFYRGGTYTVNTSATGHPFYFTTDNGTNFVAGSYVGEYTSGVTNSRAVSGAITFTVPAGAPDTLYYQCGNHAAMHGAITIKDLAVEVNNNGNYVVYAQHDQEGHATPVELRPIPTLVNQMCLTYDASVGKFVPQDLATYVENTPSFKNKIQEVAGTSTLVAADGTAIVASVNVYADSTYLPLVGNNSGDLAFATDINSLFAWTGTAWETSKLSSATGLTTGTVASARLGSGTADATTFLRGDNAWATVNTNLVADTSPQLGGDLDLNSNNITGTGGIPAANLTGTIAAARLSTATTQLESDDSTKIATTAYVVDKITTLIGGAPSTLNDLNELAAAINDDSNYNSTLTTALATKLPLAGGTMTGNLVMGTNLVDGVDISARDAILTSTTTTAAAALPKAGGTMTGNLTVTHASGNATTRLQGNTNSNSSKLLISHVSSGDGGLKYGPNNETDMFSYSDIRFNVGTANVSGSIGNERMVIKNNGKVGIGTTSPIGALDVVGATALNNAALHVKGTSSTTNDLIPAFSLESATTGTAAAGVGTSMTFFGSMSGQDNVQLGEIGFHNNNVSGAHGDFVVKTRPNGTLAERMRINSTGNVGIGTSSPAATLDVDGNAIGFPSATSDPSSPADGWTYYNTTIDTLKTYNGTGWDTLANAELGTAGNPASSAAALKSAGKPDGSYYVTINGSAKKVWVVTRYAEASYIKIVQWNNATALGGSAGVNVGGTWTDAEISNYAGKLTTADINWIIGTGGAGQYSLMRCNGQTSGDNLFNSGAGTGRLYVSSGHANYGTGWDINVTHELYLDVTSNGSWDYGLRYTNDGRSLCNHTTAAWHQDHNYNWTWLTSQAPSSGGSICHTIGADRCGTNLHWMSGVSTASGSVSWGHTSTTAFAVYMEF